MSMQTDSDIRDVVVGFITERTGLTSTDVPLSKNLLESGTIDSFGFMELIMHLEQHFSVAIEIDEHVLENYGSVEAIASSIGRLTGGR